MLKVEFAEICLAIAGRNYKLKAPLHQHQGLQDAALFLNGQIGELKQKSRTLSAEQAAVLAALQISDELLTERELLAQSQEAMAQQIARLVALAQPV